VYSIQSILVNAIFIAWGPALKLIYNATIDSDPSTLFMVCALMYAVTFVLHAYLNGKKGELYQSQSENE